MKRQILKHVISAALVGWVMISPCYVCAEPPQGMTFGQFAIAKMAGCVSIAMAVLVGASLQKKGLLIDKEEDYDFWD